MKKSIWAAVPLLLLAACGPGGDSTPPVLQLTAPQNNGTVVDSPVVVTGTATDQIGVARAGYQINGGAEEPVTIMAGQSVSLNFAVPISTAAATVSIAVNVYDAANNKATRTVNLFTPGAASGGNNSIQGTVSQGLPAAGGVSDNGARFKEANKGYPKVELNRVHALIRPSKFMLPAATQNLPEAQYRSLETQARTLAQSYNLTLEAMPVPSMGYVVFKPRAGQTVDAAAKALAANPQVYKVSRMYPRYPQAVPNDTFYARQWGARIINAEAAWEYTTGSRSVVVAVVDSGIGGPIDSTSRSGAHTDLSANLIAGYDFTPCIDMIEEAGGPYVDPALVSTFPRLRFFDADSQCGPDPYPIEEYSLDDPETLSEFGSHGTHVAGIIGAVGDNALGVAGVNWEVSIQPLRGCGLLFCVGWLEAAMYAAGMPVDADGQVATSSTVTNPTPARVINMSLGGPGYDEVEEEIFRQIYEDYGVLPIAAAGNAATDDIHTPSGYPSVMSVSSVDYILDSDSSAPGNQPAFPFTAAFSNYGPTIDIAAPGGVCYKTANDYKVDNFPGGVCLDPNVYRSPFILSTGHEWYTAAGARSDTSLYFYSAGTSMASPQVAGAAAFLYAIDPDLTPYQVREILRQTATDYNDSAFLDLGEPGRDNYYGWGVLNLAAAAEAVESGQIPDTANQAYVVAVAAGGSPAYVTTADIALFYRLSRLPAGSYSVYAGIDANGNGVIGDAGEAFGTYAGSLNLSSGTNLDNISFTLENVTMASTQQFDVKKLQRLR
jgi:subtilisin family serine protease